MIWRLKQTGLSKSISIAQSLNFSGISKYFLEGGVAGEDAAQAVLAQRDHSKLDRLLFDSDRGRTVVDQFAKRIGNLQELVDPFSSFVACVVTSVTTLAVEELFVANVLPRKPQFRQ